MQIQIGEPVNCSNVLNFEIVAYAEAPILVASPEYAKIAQKAYDYALFEDYPSPTVVCMTTKSYDEDGIRMYETVFEFELSR